jgi:thymidylate synthase
MVKQYLEHSKLILSDAFSGYKPNRTHIDSISRFRHSNEYDLSKGFPLLTTKKMGIKGIIHEVIWFLKGDGNIKYLADNNVHIWDDNAFEHHLKSEGLKEKFPTYSADWKQAKDDYIARIKEDDDFAEQHGDMGPIYGVQWRHWKTTQGEEIDQIANMVNRLVNSPMSRRNIVTAWNPEEVDNMALPPCHAIFQANVQDDRLDVHLYQRSCDMFLGVPFNIASYAMLTQILANQAELKPGLFGHSFGDAHFYCGADERGAFYEERLEELKRLVGAAQGRDDFEYILDLIKEDAPPEREGKQGQDHVPLILQQLAREPRPLPKMTIAKKPYDELTIEDFTLDDYYPHKRIKASMAV